MRWGAQLQGKRVTWLCKASNRNRRLVFLQFPAMDAHPLFRRIWLAGGVHSKGQLKTRIRP
jgi:hypothetical protein